MRQLEKCSDESHIFEFRDSQMPGPSQSCECGALTWSVVLERDPAIYRKLTSDMRKMALRLQGIEDAINGGHGPVYRLDHPDYTVDEVHILQPAQFERAFARWISARGMETNLN